MGETADVVVIGGGVQGASLAFHLASRGTRVAVVERSTVAAGATGRSSGLVRVYYDLLAEARLAAVAFEWFRDWEARVGGDCGFTRTGFLWIEPGEAAERVRANVASHRALGVDSTSGRRDRDARPRAGARDRRRRGRGVGARVRLRGPVDDRGLVHPGGPRAGRDAPHRRGGHGDPGDGRPGPGRGHDEGGDRRAGRRQRGRRLGGPTWPRSRASRSRSRSGATTRATSVSLRPCRGRSPSSSTSPTRCTSVPRGRSSSSSASRTTTRWAARRTGNGGRGADVPGPRGRADRAPRAGPHRGHLPRVALGPGRPVDAGPAADAGPGRSGWLLPRLRPQRDRLQDGARGRPRHGGADPRRRGDAPSTSRRSRSRGSRRAGCSRASTAAHPSGARRPQPTIRPSRTGSSGRRAGASRGRSTTCRTGGCAPRWRARRSRGTAPAGSGSWTSAGTRSPG